MQCLPTLTVTRKETGSLKYAALQLGYMSGLAYVVALVVHQGLLLAGVA
jgi:ferrous iron transport protein B